MKIAFIGQKGIPSTGGGVERYAQDLSTRIAGLGHEVLAYTRPHYTPKQLKEFMNVRLISLPSIKTKHLDAITHTILASIDVLFRKVDVIHYQSIGPALICWLPKLLNPRLKIVSTLQSRDYEHQKWSRFAKFMLKIGERIMCVISDEVLVVTRPMKDYVKDKYGIDSYFIPNGANLYEAEGSKLIKKWGLERNSYIVAVSRIVKHKGLGYLIDAYNQIQTDKKLVIVGEGSFTDSYVRYLKAKAMINPNIIFTNNQTGEVLAQLYDNAYLFIQPSESEGLSLALLEAMARSKCVLVSDISENREAIGEAGFCFESKNIYDLSNKMHCLLENPRLVDIKGEQARHRIEQYYNWDNIAKQVIGVYNKTGNKERKSLLKKLKFSTLKNK
ncbi:MAG: glycosyltransferase family 4 protein [bacterium]